MTSSVIVDPLILAFTSFADNRPSVESAILRILELSEIARSSPQIDLISGRRVQLALFSSEHFPFRPKLLETLQSTGLYEVFDAQTLNTIIINLAERLVSIAARSRADEIIVDEFSLSPPDDGMANAPALREELRETFVYLCASIIDGEAWAGHSCVMLSDCFEGSSQVKISCSAPLVDPPLGEPPNESFKCEAVITRVISFRDWLLKIDASGLWSRANAADELDFAIRARATQLRNSLGIVSPEKLQREFVVGSDFLRSIQVNQALHGPYMQVTLEACAKLAADAPINDVKPFQTSAGSGIQLERSDGALAFRAHLSKGKVALRLMYWQLPSGSIEFANVGPKGEEKIF